MNIEEAHVIYGKIKVLHIDDDEIQLDIIKDMLEQLNDNIIVDSEIDGLKALEKIKTNEYDCILLDYSMPVYDGIEIANRIRNFSKVPIIMYTIQDIEDMHENSFSIDMIDYVRKEFNISNISVLENKILNITKRYRTQKISEEILKNVNDSIVIVDKDSNIYYHNELFKKYIGETNLVGTPILNIVEKSYKKTFKDFLINKEENTVEVILVDSKKINHYIEIHKSIINKNNELLTLYMNNVTAHVLKSKKEQSSDNRFNAIAKISPDGILALSLFGYITYVNPVFLTLTGFSEEDFIGKHIINIPTLKGRDMKPLLRTLKDFVSGKLDFSSLEFPYTRKDGTSGIGDAYCATIKVDGKTELVLSLIHI